MAERSICKNVRDKYDCDINRVYDSELKSVTDKRVSVRITVSYLARKIFFDQTAK